MWKFRGYEGSDNVAELIGTLNGRIGIVCGGGFGVFEELKVAEAFCDSEPIIFAVNGVGTILPKAAHWIGLDTKFFEYGAKIPTHTACGPGANYDWRIEPEHFHLSGYFAAQVAWLMGCDRIVLCGCPGEAGPRYNGTMNDTPHFGYGSGSTSSDTCIREQLNKQMKQIPDFKRAVRSTSRGKFSEHYFGSFGGSICPI